ncbi:MAG: hypothetical protein U5K76_01780 [Woeseiaceae bacterium]|nr:hypothetical protein [Woeseiaceae bacterium]
MRVIMVPVADRPECAVALDGAFSLAERLEANVRATHIRPHRYSRVALPEETSYLLAPGDMPELSVAEQKTAEAASRAAKALVEKVALERGFAAAGSLDGSSARRLVWHEDVGNIANLMPVIGPFADLIAVSRPQKSRSRIARAFVEQSLLHSGRPVLILPARRRFRPGRRVVIGWDRALNAMRSIVAALIRSWSVRRASASSKAATARVAAPRSATWSSI